MGDTMREKRILWCSEKQKAVLSEVAGPVEYMAVESPYGGYRFTPAPSSPYKPARSRLNDGTIVEFTESLPEGEKPLWDDAICLGEGEYCGG